MSDWQIAPARQPNPDEYRYDLETALASVVSLRATIADDAFTAETLGTERAGSGVFIRDGVVLTIGYLITEAEDIWLTLNDGRVVPAHPLAYDQVTGFGLVQALARLDVPALPLGRAAAVQPGTPVVMAAGGGREHAMASFIVGRQEFAGYWEYLLDEAIFTAPSHPLWGGAALIGPGGDLLGIGSLQVEQKAEGGQEAHLNMSVPIDLLPPILEDLLTTGRASRAARPWLGLFATELEGKVFAVGLSTRGPAQRADLRPGDMIVAVDQEKVTTLAEFYRAVWGLGPAGAEVPLSVIRDGRSVELRVKSADREHFLKAPRMHS